MLALSDMSEDELAAHLRAAALYFPSAHGLSHREWLDLVVKRLSHHLELRPVETVEPPERSEAPELWRLINAYFRARRDQASRP